MSHDQQVSGAVLRLRMSSPFFAALLLFARLEPRSGLGTAATDGRAIYYDPAFFASLDTDGIAAVLLHEVLHCALRHPSRCGRRDPKKNTASSYLEAVSLFLFPHCGRHAARGPS